MGATRLYCMIALILAGAAFLTLSMGYIGLPRHLAEWIGSLGLSPFALIVALTMFYIVLGCFLDGISMVVLTMGVILPTVEKAGIDLLWFGIFIVLVVEMAQITPPVGFNLFVLQGMTGKQITWIARHTMPDVPADGRRGAADLVLARAHHVPAAADEDGMTVECARKGAGAVRDAWHRKRRASDHAARVSADQRARAAHRRTRCASSRSASSSATSTIRTSASPCRSRQGARRFSSGCGTRSPRSPSASRARTARSRAWFAAPPRAIGQACGANRIALIMPCHRVVGAMGSMGGFMNAETRRSDRDQALAA